MKHTTFFLGVLFSSKKGVIEIYNKTCWVERWLGALAAWGSTQRLRPICNPSSRGSNALPLASVGTAPTWCTCIYAGKTPPMQNKKKSSKIAFNSNKWCKGLRNLITTLYTVDQSNDPVTFFKRSEFQQNSLSSLPHLPHTPRLILPCLKDPSKCSLSDVSDILNVIPGILQAEQLGIEKERHPLVHGVGMESVQQELRRQCGESHGRWLPAGERGESNNGLGSWSLQIFRNA